MRCLIVYDVCVSVCLCVNRCQFNHDRGENEMSNDYRPRNENNTCAEYGKTVQTVKHTHKDTHKEIARSSCMCVCVVLLLLYSFF